MTRAQQKRDTKRRAVIKVKEQRAARLAQGCCPLHGSFMSQKELCKDQRHSIVECGRCRNAGIPTIARCLDAGSPCTLLYKRAWKAAVRALMEQHAARNNSKVGHDSPATAFNTAGCA
jgi:hypothetical protein